MRRMRQQRRRLLTRRNAVKLKVTGFPAFASLKMAAC
jgi:hypothetical protein